MTGLKGLGNQGAGLTLNSLWPWEHKWGKSDFLSMLQEEALTTRASVSDSIMKESYLKYFSSYNHPCIAQFPNSQNEVL